jgi:O-antigen/teichoic acid export membrane protein
MNVVLYRATIRKFRPNTAVDPETLPFVKHLSFMGILGKVGENIDKILVFHYLGAVQLAMYTFAQTPIAQLKLLADIPVRVALPKISERDFETLQSSLPRKTLFLVGGMFLAVMVYILIAPVLFKILFPAYVDAVIYTQFLALSLVFTPSAMFSAALTAHMKTRELYISQAILPMLKIGLFVVMLPLYGIWGAIWVTVIHQFITFVCFGYLFWQTKA